MTIAVCYLSPEGVVLGADSTSSIMLPSNQGPSFHYFNHNQKVFEIGEESTLGLVTWGLGGVGATSHRTLVAQLADKLRKTAPVNVLAVATHWANIFWSVYSAGLKAELADYKILAAKLPLNPGASPPDPKARTKEEQERFNARSRELVVGFCLGGYVKSNRSPEAFIVNFEPGLGVAPTPVAVQMNGVGHFGVPNLILRLIRGYDVDVPQAILKSGNWKGTDKDLAAILERYHLSTAVLPIRDAIDYVYTSIYSTIKALKFSSFSQVCGGPIELAVITSDRSFRWVRHKSFDSAIHEG